MAAGADHRAARLLRVRGHEVHTPTLTGLGERSDLLPDQVDLDMHIQDAVNVLLHGDLRDVIFVGHGSGGMAVTGVADRMAEENRPLGL